MKREKIFGVGAHKTAKSSLVTALKLIDIKCLDWVHHSITYSNIQNNNFRFFDNRPLKKFDGLFDLPIPSVYKELDKEYPNSKFILTVRNAEDWLRDVKTRIVDDGCIIGPEENLFYGVKKFDEESFLKKYLTHNQEVMDYFRDRPNDLLVMNICDDGHGWSELIRFLDKNNYPYDENQKIIIKYLSLFAEVDKDQIISKFKNGDGLVDFSDSSFFPSKNTYKYNELAFV
tara:strand:- start:96 stop:785 length:690 start_codon:yes stop_codon:yes gene_type:complete